MLKNDEILRQLAESPIFRDYEKAFNDATQLPLALRPLEVWNHALRGKKHENPFCSLMAKSNRSCAGCLEVQEKLTNGKANGAISVTCFAGLSDTAIPIRVGDKVIGFLQTGQIALHHPTKAGFSKVTSQLKTWGTKVNLKSLKDAYFHSKELTQTQYLGTLHLLEDFAKHLSIVANEILVQEKHEESPLIREAKIFIEVHQAESLSLKQIAKALNISTFYFCKMFKKGTGLTFIDYLVRIRIESTKKLLLNRNLRINEVAYDCGFVSLTHFNRIFKRVVGKSPTAYRASLP
jgi:AraC-like DNA-binding protein/ligand-binding sensor protein